MGEPVCLLMGRETLVKIENDGIFPQTSKVLAIII